MLVSTRRLVILTVLSVLLATGIVTEGNTAEAAVARPVAAVVGDSYTAAWGAVYQRTPPTTDGAWWRYTLRDLGWTPGTIVADAGGGFVRRGGAGRTFAEALRRTPLNPRTDYVLLQGGLNDEAESPAAVAAGVREVLALIRAQAPKAEIIVVGSFLPQPTKVSANYVKVARTIGSTGAIGKTPFLNVFMCTFTLAPDGRHPDAAGHKAIGRWVAWRIAHGMDNASGYHLDRTRRFYEK